MIDIDPRLYLPEEYVITWSCPSCGHVSELQLGKLDTAHCVRCDHLLSGEDRSSLEEFRRLIA